MHLKVSVRSCMLYGSETWPLKREEEAKLERNEMKMIRWMVGVKVTDRVRNTDLRKRLGLEELQIILRKRRLRWFGHVERREGEWVKECMKINVSGKTPRGRPKKTWWEIVEKDMKMAGLKREDARDRVLWRDGVTKVR